jgi:hypothetical protein
MKNKVVIVTVHPRAWGLSALYARRWNVELDLRNLKTPTGMDILSCQTPQMNEKQLWVHFTGLQRNPTAHGAGRLQCRRGPAQPQLHTRCTLKLARC